MFNALEVTTLKVRFSQALAAVAAGLVASLPLASLSAQSSRTADPNAPRLMVGVFRSGDKAVGVQTADAIRSRVTADVPVRNLWVIPKQDITNTLEQSGFPTTEALASHDARALAQLLRADEYIVGQVVRDSAGGFRVDANLVLTRDNSLVQPLGSHRVDKADKAAAAISREFQAAQKAFQSERNCVNNARDKKYSEAIAAARKGVQEYGRSTLARICLANVYVDLRDAGGSDSTKIRAYNDSAAAVAREILTVDPLSRRALAIQYDALKAAGQTAEATDVLLRLVAADPSNTRLLEQVINEFAANGQAARAVPFVNQLVTDNPGDPNFLSLQMRVKLAAKDYKGGIAAGEELVRADTAAATAELFSRLAAAAVIDSQPQKAAQLAAQGVAKFPANADLVGTYAEALAASGQSEQAVQVIQRALQANPNAGALYTAQARFLNTSNQHEQALASLKQGFAKGDSSAARFALGFGQTAQRTASGSKKPEDFQTALAYLQFANESASSPEGQLLLGATSLSYGQTLLGQAQTQAKARQNAAACQSSRQAKSQFETAQTSLPQAGRANPQAAQQLLAALNQLAPYADQIAKAVCK